MFLISTLVLIGIGFGNLKLISTGTLKDVPKAKAHPGFKDLICSNVSEDTFVLMFFTISKSLGWNTLNTMKLEHWLKSVLES